MADAKRAGKKGERIVRYTDERNDEFSAAKIEPRRIDGGYRYIRSSPLGRFARFFWYKIVFFPFAFLYAKIAFGLRIENKEILRPYRDRGYFLFGNHTQPLGDALFPPLMTSPQDNFVIVHPANVSIPLLGRITPALGALPLPDDIAAYRNFRAAVARRIGEGHPVVIYPEAHIWPYYTGIRPFPSDSFTYAVSLGAPVFCFTNTYQKRGKRKRPRIVTYLDGPFFPDPALDPRAARAALCEQVYETMKQRAALSTVAYIRYLKKEKPEHEQNPDPLLR